MRFLYLFLAFLFLTQCNPSGTDRDEGPFQYYPIKRRVDGDTFIIDNGSADGLKIRLIGIDSPEAYDYGNRFEEPWGKEASAFMANLIRGQKVRLEYDVDEFDKYGRTLAYAFLEDGRFVNGEMIRNGFAEVYSFPPNVYYQDTLYYLQKLAREEKVGMWADYEKPWWQLW